MKNFTQTLLALLLMLLGSANVHALESYDFQELCMALGKGGPWAVNDGGDAGYTIGDATMHYLGDYEEQGFTWNQRFAYEYVADRGKFTFRNKNNKKDGNCGMFSWDYAHYFSILGLKNGDKVTITVGTGTVTFVSTNAEGVAEGDAVTSNQAYTITTSDATTRLDIQMAKASLIAKIVIEPAGEETVPAITVSPKALKLVPGATAQFAATVDPANIAVQWKSSNEQVATVAADGTVTAVAPGTANIVAYWNSQVSDATAEAAGTVTVADVDLSSMTVAKEYNFEAMGDVTLELAETAAGAIWNEANSKNNNVFFCTNEGLELLAVQAAVSGNKGWSIVDGQGLFLASGAGRCAAIAGITKGQVVEFIYTGAAFYTRSDDDGIEKTALNEGTGRAIYQADEDGMIGFELVKGNAVKKITIYDAAAESAEVTFDFNASDYATSSNDSEAGNITEPLVITQDGVTLTVSVADEGKTPNRFWGTNAGPQLRCYSGTITIEAASTIKSIVFDASSNFNLTPDNGTLTGKTWNGEAAKVVFTVNKNTQINKITVSAAAAEVPSTPVAANIAAFKALEKGTEAKLTLTDAYVTAVYNNSHYYVQDATGGIYFYNTGLSLQAGTKLNGTVTAQLDIYNSLPELVKTSATSADGFTATEGSATPKNVTVAEALTEANWCLLVTIPTTSIVKDGNNYYATSGDARIQVYDQFRVIPSDYNYPETATITGVIGLYKGTPQIYPLTAESIVPPVADAIESATLQQPADAQLYNLRGQRVSTPQKGQLYIVNGHKHIAQ